MGGTHPTLYSTQNPGCVPENSAWFFTCLRGLDLTTRELLRGAGVPLPDFEDDEANHQQALGTILRWFGFKRTSKQQRRGNERVRVYRLDLEHLQDLHTHSTPQRRRLARKIREWTEEKKQTERPNTSEGVLLSCAGGA